MKNAYLLIFIGLSFICNGQGSIRLSEVIFPTVTTLPTCNATEKGKTVMLSSTSQLYYCNGSAWNLLSIPSVSESKFAAGLGTLYSVPQNVDTQIPFSSTTITNVGNNFDNGTASYLVPSDGFYHFDFSVNFNYSGQLYFSLKLYDNTQFLVGNTSNGVNNYASVSTTKYFFAGHLIKAIVQHSHTSPLNLLPVGTNFGGYKIN